MALEAGYQPWVGTGAAVVLPRNQAPDWTSKYQLAAQERRAREAERAAKEPKADLDASGKVLSALDSDWFEAHDDQRQKMYQEVEAAVRQNVETPSQATQAEMMKKAFDFAAAQKASKETQKILDEKEKYIGEHGMEAMENADMIKGIADGKFTLGGKEYDRSKLSSPSDFAKYTQAEKMALATVRTAFNEGKYMGGIIDDAVKNAVKKTPVYMPNGDVLHKEETDPTAYDQRIMIGWQGAPRLQEIYKKRWEEEGKNQGFANPEEMYKSAYGFSQGVKTTQKNAPSNYNSRSGSGLSVQYGKTTASYYQDAGKEVIQINWTPTEGQNSVRAWSMGNGKKVEGKLTRIVSDGGNRYIEIAAPELTESGKETGKTITEKVPYNEENKTEIQDQYGVEWFKTLQDLDLFDKTPKERGDFKGQTTGSPAKKVGETQVKPAGKSANKIRVKRKSDGKTGTIEEKDFDATKYERL